MEATQPAQPAPQPAPARQLGVKNYLSILAFRVYWSNPLVMKLLVQFRVERGCVVLFDQFGVYFIVTDDTTAILCETEVQIYRLAGLTPPIEHLRAALFERMHKQTGCEHVPMTDQEYNTLTSESSVHMAAFFREYKPVSEKYAEYVKVCKSFNVTPYTPLPVVNIFWGFVVTIAASLHSAA